LKATWHGYCVGHIINLIVKSILFGEGLSKFVKELAGASDIENFRLWRRQEVIGRLHNIVKYISRLFGEQYHEFLLNFRFRKRPFQKTAPYLALYSLRARILTSQILTVRIRKIEPQGRPLATLCVAFGE